MTAVTDGRSELQHDECMQLPYILITDVAAHGSVPQQSILSSTLQQDDRSKVILFRFAADQELSAHTAPFPALLYFVSGEAVLRFGADEQVARAGTFVHMAAKLEHGIRAKTETVMLLVLLKNAPETKTAG